MANWLKFVNSVPLIFLALLFPYVLGLTYDLIPLLLSLFTGDNDGDSAGCSAQDCNLDDTPAESSRNRGDDSTGSSGAGVQGSNLDNINERYENEDLFPGSDRMDFVEIMEVYRVVYGYITDCIGSWITREVNLKLYGFHQVATTGPCPEPRLPASPNKDYRDKMQVWRDLSRLSPYDAMKGYIKFVLQHYPSDSKTKRTKGETSTAGEAGSSHGNGRKERSLTKLLLDALHYFLEHEHEDFKCIEELPLNLKDTKGRTILHWAAVDGRLHVVIFLLNHGADKNPKDNQGRTPMHYAIIHKNEALAGFLMFQRVDLHLKDNNGVSASDLMNKKKEDTPS